MRTAALVVAGLTFVFVGSIGTITDPELVDPKGDIDYKPYYLGARDHQESDVEAAWMDYDPDADTISVHLQVPSTLRFEDSPAGFTYNCKFETNLTVDQNFAGRMVAEWNHREETPDRTEVLYFAAPRGSPNLESSPLNHTFERILGEPGFYVWHIEREPLQLRGAEATDFYTLCSFYQVYPGAGGVLGGADHGFGHRSYVYGDLRPASEPIAGEHGPSATAASSSGWTEEATTSTIGLVVAMGVIAAVAFGRRKR